MIKEYEKGYTVRLSDHFISTEFDCKCSYPECEITYIDTRLINYLESKRLIFNFPLIVHSGFRCVRHNKEVGGKLGSIHLTGKASDVGFAPEHGNIAEKSSLFQDADGLGIYIQARFLHIDVRYGLNSDKQARWFG